MQPLKWGFGSKKQNILNMKARDFFNLQYGKYYLTDRINNYTYDLEVSQGYCHIKERGTLNGNSIGLHEDSLPIQGFDGRNTGFFKKTISVMARVGGIFVREEQSFCILNELCLIGKAEDNITPFSIKFKRYKLMSRITKRPKNYFLKTHKNEIKSKI